MKFIKGVLLTILILVAVGILFRGLIYRSLVTYNSIGHGTNYTVTNHKLATHINTSAKNLNDPEIKEIIKLGLSITSKQLNFTAAKNHNDPNRLVTSKAAHCVGYAAFFATTCNYLLDKYELSGSWIAKPKKGQLYFLGIDVHKYFDSPFFKDHDFVIIENKKTGEIFSVDPTINDYLKIDYVSYEK